LLQIHFSVDYDMDEPAMLAIRQLLDRDLHHALPDLPHEMRRLAGASGLEAQKVWAARRIRRADLVVVLVGRETYAKPLIRHEIAVADAMTKPMFGLDVTTEPPTPPNPFSYAVSTHGRKVRPYTVHRLSSDRPSVSLLDFVHIATRHKSPKKHTGQLDA
jgi:hypothetical protein